MTPDPAALRTLADRADDDSSAPVVTLDTATVRALCDAADEVERHRSMTRELSRELLKKGDEVERLRNPDIATPREREALLTVERMVTAHAALVADLRALCRESSRYGVGPTYPVVHVNAVLAVLDRHAPGEGS